MGGVLSYEFIRDNLSIIGPERLREITDAILSNDATGLAGIFAQFKTESIEPRRLLEQYLYFLRESAFEALQSPDFPRLIRLFDACTGAYGKIKDFPNGFLLLEMTFLGQIQTIHGETSSVPVPRAVAAPRSKEEEPKAPKPVIVPRAIDRNDDAPMPAPTAPVSRTAELTVPVPLSATRVAEPITPVVSTD